ncbi:Crp1p KNAG_0H03820 [Huiozyma naganishii CBS 8797]|uniref:AMP-activated protein kinase glycogen-binding domain-containing protein n=1 Tax=Huiozyma naganishii (strain ATCC MYA-139 / BCRC 22969 / CBS 8797 / KCTC 17520 / NBRC 10181 / NCYC 3082 / Yp74L-3) TaxID=1071383 RepID=J7S9Y4_HUIN7|nr:hypothetical protein KNAG_0H03820 [Kazachstania naganishii CBS 8797]CCK71796.1 hypothetical protein KNAG_0H03820 [Kazachstania naganishii CBS 8797]
MAVSTQYTFCWPAGPSEVFITGEFDHWAGSLPLVKTSKGDFEITFPVEVEGDDKFFFKFIVDGEWTASDAYSKEGDGCGFENNYITAEDVAAPGIQAQFAAIPEAGGLSAKSNVGEKEEAEGAHTGDVHIMPVEEMPAQGTPLAGPGPVIVQHPEEVKEFSEIRDVDAKALNEQLNAELNAQLEDVEPVEDAPEVSEVKSCSSSESSKQEEPQEPAAKPTEDVPQTKRAEVSAKSPTPTPAAAPAKSKLKEQPATETPRTTEKASSPKKTVPQKKKIPRKVNGTSSSKPIIQAKPKSGVFSKLKKLFN